MKRALRAGVPWALVAGAAIGLLGLWYGRARPATGGEPSAAAGSGLDAAVYGRACELRQRLRLTDEDLAAMGCDGGRAATALGRVLAWSETNQAAWEARSRETAAARRRLQAAVRAANVGPADPARPREIAQLRAALAAALADEQAVLAAAAAYVEAALTDGQKALWAALRAAPAEAGELAYAPGVTEAQLKAIALARTRLARRQATARTAADRATAPDGGS